MVSAMTFCPNFSTIVTGEAYTSPMWSLKDLFSVSEHVEHAYKDLRGQAM